MRQWNLSGSELNALPRLRISRAQFLVLLEYSVTNPTGVFVGKLWRCRLASGRWVVRGYVEVADPTKAGIMTWKPFFTPWPTPEVRAAGERYQAEVRRVYGRG